MKILTDEATIEQILSDMTYHEDIESSLTVMASEDGGVYVRTYDGYEDIEAPTLKEALIKLHVKWLKSIDGDWLKDELERSAIDWVERF